MRAVGVFKDEFKLPSGRNYVGGVGAIGRAYSESVESVTPRSNSGSVFVKLLKGPISRKSKLLQAYGVTALADAVVALL